MSRSFVPIFVVIACAAGTVLAAEVPARAGRLTYATPRGVEFDVSEDGLCAIRAGGRDLAAGGWSAWNADGWFKAAGAGPGKPRAILEKSISILGADRARVRHVSDDLVCTFDYAFDGEDVTVSARVENEHPHESLGVTGFSGLTFTFGRPPTGFMLNQHVSYFQKHGIRVCHPGEWARIGGSHAADDAIGVGLTPWRTGLNRTLIMWDFTDWHPEKRDALPTRRPIYFCVQAIPPRAAATFDLRMRVSPDRDWRHLLAPYREHFQATFGSVRYRADDRWIGTDYLNHSQAAVAPKNPYGFHDGHRRIDTAEGAGTFCDRHLAALRAGDGQGVILWGMGGDDPRGGMYRPDFDVIPPEVDAQWDAIRRRFADAGLRLGVCTRPRHLAVRDDWKTDTIIDINPHDEGHRAMLWKRFKSMIDRGCSLFYLDSFGSSLEDVILMQFLRERLGPEVLTFCEHQCDAIFPYSGGYSECTLDAGDPARPRYEVWSGVELWEVYRWLTPGAQLAARLYQTKGVPPADFESPDRFFLRHRMTPLLPAFDLDRAAALKSLQPEFLDGQWRWKLP